MGRFRTQTRILVVFSFVLLLMFVLDDTGGVGDVEGVGDIGTVVVVVVLVVLTPPIFALICCNTESRFAGLTGDLEDTTLTGGFVLDVGRLVEDFFEEEGEEREGRFFPNARRRR